jgi:hypothetical protein
MYFPTKMATTTTTTTTTIMTIYTRTHRKTPDERAADDITH